MRAFVLSCGLCVTLLFPKSGNAQVYEVRPSLPEANAAAAEWQINSELIPFAGLIYAPTREFRLFDPQVMTQIGVYKGVPVYADATLQPWSIVYVPLGGAKMRAYNRATQRDLDQAAVIDTDRVTHPSPVSTGTSGTAATGLARDTAPNVVPAVAPTRPRAGRIDHPADGGVWVEFQGRRWYSDGEAVSYSPDRFTPIGDYHGFPVYRDTTRKRDEIWVSTVKDGALAPYAIRR